MSRSNQVTKRYLIIKKKKLAEQQDDPVVAKHNKSKLRTVIGAIFDVGKKFIDIVDDIWSALSNTPIPKKIIDLLNPFLIGAVGGIINVVESVLGVKRAYKAYNNKNRGQRKLRIGMGVATSILGAGGTAAAIILILSGAGIVLAGAAAMPVVIPGVLLGIYSLILLRKAYTFHRAKQEEAKAEVEYKALLHHEIELINLKNHSQVVHTLLKELEPKIDAILAEKKDNRQITADDEEKLAEYKSYLELQDKLDARYSEVQEKLEPAKTKYQHAHQERLKAERKVGLGTAEVVASGIVLIGTILGLSALLGVASVASFGILPLALIVAGVVLGVAIKIFEKIDDKKGNKWSAGIRGFFSRLFSRSSKPHNVSLSAVLANSPGLLSPQKARDHHDGELAGTAAKRESTTSIVAATEAPRLADVGESHTVSDTAVPPKNVPVNSSFQPNSARLFSRPDYKVALVQCPDGVRRLIPQTNGVKR